MELGDHRMTYVPMKALFRYCAMILLPRIDGKAQAHRGPPRYIAFTQRLIAFRKRIHFCFDDLSSARSFSAESGRSFIRTPVNRATALATAGAMPNTDISPTPLAP
jgi:hypothetical protein